MKKNLFFAIPLLVSIAACSSVKSTRSSVIVQGITGTVTEFTGNAMPHKDAPRAAGKGIYSEIYVYEKTNISQVIRQGDAPLYTSVSTKQVASVKTDSSGHFIVALPVGSYSVFVKRGSLFYANRFDAANNIAPVQVEEGKLTRADVSVTLNASF